MRISKDLAPFIKQLLSLSEAKLYLFGSRTDDEKRGGDTDLLIVGERKLSLEEILELQSELVLQFGDQKFDILSTTHDDESTFIKSILHDAIEL